VTTRIEKDDLGFDEFFSDNVKSCHIERMRENHLWIKIVANDGNEYIIWLSSDLRITGRVEAINDFD
jgi:hypothetical protein